MCGTLRIWQKAAAIPMLVCRKLPWEAYLKCTVSTPRDSDLVVLMGGQGLCILSILQVTPSQVISIQKTMSQELYREWWV